MFYIIIIIITVTVSAVQQQAVCRTNIGGRCGAVWRDGLETRY